MAETYRRHTMFIIKCTIPLNDYMYRLVSPPHRISLMHVRGLLNVFVLSISPVQKKSCVITPAHQQSFDIHRRPALGFGIVTLSPFLLLAMSEIHALNSLPFFSFPMLRLRRPGTNRHSYASNRKKTEFRYNYRNLS